MTASVVNPVCIAFDGARYEKLDLKMEKAKTLRKVADLNIDQSLEFAVFANC